MTVRVKLMSTQVSFEVQLGVSTHWTGKWTGTVEW